MLVINSRVIEYLHSYAHRPTTQHSTN